MRNDGQEKKNGYNKTLLNLECTNITVMRTFLICFTCIFRYILMLRALIISQSDLII